MFLSRTASIIEHALRDSYDRFGQEVDPVTYFNGPTRVDLTVEVHHGRWMFCDINDIVDSYSCPHDYYDLLVSLDSGFARRPDVDTGNEPF